MKVFIGSSTEALDIAENLAVMVRQLGHEPFVWCDLFKPSNITFSTLLDLKNTVDCGLFVLAPDDKVMKKEVEENITRDNVLIEAGILFGAFDITRVAFCKLPDVDVPSDWSGITLIPYGSKNSPYSKADYYTVKNDIKIWLAFAQESMVNNKIVNHFLSSELPNFETLVPCVKTEIMIASYFISISQTSTSLNEAIASGKKVRLLLADYWGSNLKATAIMLDGIKTDGARVKAKLKSTLLFFAAEKENGRLPSNLEIRSIDYVFPTRMTIVDPDSQEGFMKVHISSYKNRIATKSTFTLIKQDPWFERYRKEFEELWHDAQDIDFEKIQTLLN